MNNPATSPTAATGPQQSRVIRFDGQTCIANVLYTRDDDSLFELACSILGYRRPLTVEGSIKIIRRHCAALGLPETQPETR